MTNTCDKKWYVLQVYNLCELSVKEKIETLIQDHNLGDTIKEIIVPFENIISVSPKGKKTYLKKAIYPGYVYLQIDDYTHKIWQYLKMIPKVSKFIGEKEHPVPMSQKEIAKILALNEKMTKNPEARYKIAYRVGDEVRIKSGNFISLKGVVVSHNPESKEVNVEVNIFGRGTNVLLNEMDVEIIKE